MAKRTHNDLEINQTRTSLEVFMKNYNLMTPDPFPRTTVDTLNRFQAAFPALFKGGNTWSIDRHRKRVMDWMLAQHDLA